MKGPVHCSKSNTRPLSLLKTPVPQMEAVNIYGATSSRAAGEAVMKDVEERYRDGDWWEERVGKQAVCVLGLKVNDGAVIVLRLQTVCSD